MLKDKLQDIFDEQQVADFLNVSVRTLRNRRQAGEGPRAFKAGKTVFFHIDDVRDYLDACHKTAA